MQKKFLIYKVTNLLNDRFYIGMHIGFPDDNYMGSGRRIKAEIKKYGRENFKKEILEELNSRAELVLREKQIVNDELRQNPLCLNLKNGGDGGGGFWSEEQHLAASRRGGRIAGLLHGRNNAYRAHEILRKSGNFFGGSNNKLGTITSEQTKSKISKTFKERGIGVGEKNSQFGTCWVTKDSKSAKIKKEQLDEYLANGYLRGRHK